MNRLAQFLTWDDAMRESYYEDLTEAESVGWNLLTEKYARMMRYTCLLYTSHIGAEYVWSLRFLSRYQNNLRCNWYGFARTEPLR